MIQVLLTWLALPLFLLGLSRGADARAPRRILVVQTAKIGDAVCTTPLLRALRKGFPDAAVSVLCAPLAAPLFRINPRVTEVIEFDRRGLRGLLPRLQLARGLRRGNFDLVLCCNSAAHWPCLMLWAGIPRRVGLVADYLGRTQRLANGLWSVRATHRPGRLVMETYGDMLVACGIPAGNLKKEIFAAAGAEDRARAIVPEAPNAGEIVGIAVSSGNKLKELGEDRLAGVVTGLLARRPGVRIVFLGTAADGPTADALLRRHPTAMSRLINGCGTLDLADLPALLARLSLFIGVDSGLTYMADALDIPLVSVAGPADMADARPLGPRAVIIGSDLPCAPCSHYFRAPYGCHVGTRACISGVSAGEILDKACTLLERAAA